jgi:hypothetical protein
VRHIATIRPDIKKASPPFEVVVTARNLQSGIDVIVDGVDRTSVV